MTDQKKMTLDEFINDIFAIILDWKNTLPLYLEDYIGGTGIDKIRECVNTNRAALEAGMRGRTDALSLVKDPDESREDYFKR